MTRLHAVVVAALVTLLSSTGLACHDSAAPARGTIEVTIRSSGSDVDPDGYVVTVDARLTRRVPANTTVIFTDIAVGEHSLDVGNLASNCTITDANPRRVTVIADTTVTADFPVGCISRIGSIHVKISTIGARLDPDGYRLSVDGG